MTKKWQFQHNPNKDERRFGWILQNRHDVLDGGLWDEDPDDVAIIQRIQDGSLRATHRIGCHCLGGKKCEACSLPK